MKTLACGIPQAVIPPHERRLFRCCVSWVFSGSDEQVLERLHARHCTAFQRRLPYANVGSQCGNDRATADTLDGKVHLTVASLNNKFHRSLEAPSRIAVKSDFLTTKREILVSIRRLPQVALLGDEGRQTTIVSAVITVNRVYNFLSTGGRGNDTAFPLSGATNS